MTTAATKERPILFSGPMVRAILDEQKSQTRRVVKYMPALGEPGEWCPWVGRAQLATVVGDYRRYCPYGVPGERLYVRETLRAVYETESFDMPETGRTIGGVYYGRNSGTSKGWTYAVDGECLDDWPVGWEPKGDTVSSIYMPKWAARIWLELTGVRVEQLQDINESGAIEEGCTGEGYSLTAESFAIARQEFEQLWDSLNAKRGYPWSGNPWVWVMKFKRCER